MLPVEIIRYIFKFSEDWWLLNGKRLIYTNHLKKLPKPERVHSCFVGTYIYAVKLNLKVVFVYYENQINRNSKENKCFIVYIKHAEHNEMFTMYCFDYSKLNFSLITCTSVFDSRILRQILFF